MTAKMVCVLVRRATLLSLCMLLATSCSQNNKPRQNGILFETRWYSLVLPIDWRYSGIVASCTFTSPDRKISIALSPVILKPGDSADKVVQEVEVSLLEDKRHKTLRHWRGHYPIGSQKLPALFVIRQGGGKQIKIVNTYINQDSWLLGIGVIQDLTREDKTDNKAAEILSSLKVKQVNLEGHEWVKITD